MSYLSPHEIGIEYNANGGVKGLTSFSKDISMIKGASSTKMEHVVKMMKNSSRSNYKSITSQAKALQAAQKATGTGLDFRKINVQQNEIGERLATKKELRSFKKKFGQDAYTKLSKLQREEYVFEQIMKNKHLFDPASIQHSRDYINRLRQMLR